MTPPEEHRRHGDDCDQDGPHDRQPVDDGAPPGRDRLAAVGRVRLQRWWLGGEFPDVAAERLEQGLQPAQFLLEHDGPWTREDIPSWLRAEVLGGTLVIDPSPYESDELPELARQRLEIIEGALYLSPAPATVHQELVYRLAKALEEHCPPDLRVVIGPNARTSEAPGDVLIPDLAVVEASQFRLTATSVPCSAVVLVIEVLSPSTRRKDTYVKAPVYATLGIGHYWTVDPRRGSVVQEIAARGGSGWLTGALRDCDRIAGEIGQAMSDEGP